MRHGSLFSGIGGFDLAAEWMGWENVFHCEKDEFCLKVLKKYWPNVKTHDDITRTDFGVYRGRIDVLSGGFPCQPFSTAGKRKGTEDNRYLWPAMLNTIETIQPRWVVGENVPGIVNWSKGLVFEQVQIDLENKGYKVSSSILPACSINAPHRRDRVWFIAYSEKSPLSNENKSRSWAYPIPKERFDGDRQPEPSLPGMDDGISDWVDRIGSLGNAVVPQVVYQIFKTIEDYESHLR